jgi:hypothetical protein
LLLLFLFILFQRSTFLLKSFLHIDYFLFFDSQLSADLRYLMFQLLFKLDDTVLSSLEFDGFSTYLGLELCNSLHGVIELPLSFTFFCFPSCSDLFYPFDLSLLQPSLELLFLGPFPHLNLPHSLIFSPIVWVGVFLTCRFDLLRTLSNLAHILEVDNTPGESTSLARSFILNYHILIAHSHGVTLWSFL